MALYFVLLALSAVLFISIRWGGADPINLTFMLQVVDAVVILMWCVRMRADVSPGLKVGRPLWLPAAAILGILTCAVAHFSLYAINRVFGPGLILRETPEYFERGFGWSTIILSVCVQPAIFEELAFRGVILGSLQRVMDAKEAIIVSAAMFMILHLSFLSFPHLFVLGLVLGYLRWRTGSLYAGMVLHFTHNLVACVIEARGYF